MKQLLCVVVIHLLILHQYQKDKTEALAPQKIAPKTIAPALQPYTWLSGSKSTHIDTLHYLHQKSQPVRHPYQHLVYLYW